MYLKEQLQELRKYFMANHYPSYEQRLTLATRLGLEENQVQVRPPSPPPPYPQSSRDPLGRWHFPGAEPSPLPPSRLRLEGPTQLARAPWVAPGWTPSSPRPLCCPNQPT